MDQTPAGTGLYDTLPAVLEQGAKHEAWNVPVVKTQLLARLWSCRARINIFILYGVRCLDLALSNDRPDGMVGGREGGRERERGGGREGGRE